MSESVGTIESSNLNQKRLNLEHKAGEVGVANCSKVTNIHQTRLQFKFVIHVISYAWGRVKRKGLKVFDIWSKRIFWELTPEKRGWGGGKLMTSLIERASLGDDRGEKGWEFELIKSKKRGISMCLYILILSLLSSMVGSPVS